jgi:hypothetical protein
MNRPVKSLVSMLLSIKPGCQSAINLNQVASSRFARHSSWIDTNSLYCHGQSSD